MDVLDSHFQRLIFHRNVREQIMFLLMLVILYLFSFVLIFKCQRRYSEYAALEDDELNVYYNMIWLCSVALAVAWLAGIIMPLTLDKKF